jgi:hypothetical protein
VDNSTIRLRNCAAVRIRRIDTRGGYVLPQVAIMRCSSQYGIGFYIVKYFP